RKSDKIFHIRQGYQSFIELLVAIFLTRKLRGDTLKDIGRQFHMERYSSVSSIIKRIIRQAQVDGNLKQRVERVAGGVSKRHE
ncbi:MAG: hypothetical protein SV375_00655, partial [Thermodesulfobacteriota bacterium]|nr:hypothetical protein [Thermodesulfobacteriota bacterium]